MKVTVIGHWGGYPAAGGASSAYVVEKDGFVLLVDVGSAALSKLQKYYDVMDVDAVIISHYHADHIADVGVLQHARLVHSYVTERDDILPIYGHTEDPEAFEKLSHDFTEGRPYNPKESLEIGPFTITFLKTAHSVPCYGMRITDGETTVVYTADTAYQEEWIDFADKADLLITDCNFYENQDGSEAGHMNSKEGSTIAFRAQVKELLLSHLPQFGDQHQLVEEAKNYYDGPIHLAEEGFIWKSKE